MHKENLSEHTNCLLQWYAVVTRSRAEKKLATYLSEQQWQVYVPIQTQWRQWSDRKKKVEMPLIPSFIFVRTTNFLLKNLIKEDGVVRILHYLGKPAIVRDEEIENLRLISQSTDSLKPINALDLSCGEEIEIVKGPLAGLNAKYINHQGKYKVIVMIEATNSYFQIEVALNNIQKIKIRA